MTQLIPVLELEPSTYATREHTSPDVSSLEDPAGWDAYWRASLADSGIEDLTPWRPGGWLVPVCEFSASQTLRTVLRCERKDNPDWDAETLGALGGGYVLVHDGIVMEPRCCGDLGNLDEWMDAAAYTDNAWKMLWIGHPWSHVRAAGDELHIAQPSEHAETSTELIDSIVVPRADLVAAIRGAEQARARFRAVLAIVLAEQVQATQLEQILDQLVGVGR